MATPRRRSARRAKRNASRTKRTSSDRARGRTRTARAQPARHGGPGVITTTSIVTCVLGLTFAIICLYVVGPPPRFRIDTLWVYFHQDAVQLCVVGLIIAALGTLFGVTRRRTRWLLGVLWILAVVASMGMFSDRLRLIVRVVYDRFG